MKRLISILIPVVLSLLVACGNDDTAENEGGEVEEVSEDIAEETPDEEESAEEDSAHDPNDLAMKPEILLEILRDSFGDDYVVEYIEDDNAFMFEPTDNEFSTLVDGILSGDSDEYITAWDSIKNGLLAQSEFISAMEEHEYAFAILNPENVDNFLLLIVDDEVRYDFADE